jgi:hypothetical protein
MRRLQHGQNRQVLLTQEDRPFHVDDEREPAQLSLSAALPAGGEPGISVRIEEEVIARRLLVERRLALTFPWRHA